MFKFIFPSICAFFLWYMQVIPDNISLAGIEHKPPLEAFLHSFDFFLVNHSFGIGLFLSICITFFSIKDSVVNPRREFQAILHNQLREIIDDCFKSQQSKVRITIFKCVNRSEAVGHYIFHRIKGWPEIFSKNKLVRFKESFKKIPNPFFDGKYLIIYNRIGVPSQTVHTTYFKIPDNPEDSEGISGLAWVSSKPVKFELPNISDLSDKIKLADSLNDLNDDAKERVRKYMQKGNVKNFRTLKSLHRYSTYLWANVLNDASNNPWGVIIIDSSDPKVMTKEKENKLSKYIYNIHNIVIRRFRE